MVCFAYSLVQYKIIILGASKKGVIGDVLIAEKRLIGHLREKDIGLELMRLLILMCFQFSPANLLESTLNILSKTRTYIHRCCGTRQKDESENWPIQPKILILAWRGFYNRLP